MVESKPHIVVQGVTMAYGSYVIQRDLDFTINRGDVFIIMGGSGCGKSTLMHGLSGLKAPAAGDVLYDGASFWQGSPQDRERIRRGFGVMFQSGALWSSMTLAENVALPLEQYTSLSPAQIRKIASLKLSLVGWGASRNSTPPRSAAACRSAPGWRGPWPWTRTFSFSTSPRPGSTRSARGAWTT